MSKFSEIIDEADKNKKNNLEERKEKYLIEIKSDIKSIQKNVQFISWLIIIGLISYFLLIVGSGTYF